MFELILFLDILRLENIHLKQTLKDLHYILSAEMVAENRRATPMDSEVIITGCNYIPLVTKKKLDDELNYLFKISDTIQNPFNK